MCRLSCHVARASRAPPPRQEHVTRQRLNAPASAPVPAARSPPALCAVGCLASSDPPRGCLLCAPQPWGAASAAWCLRHVRQPLASTAAAWTQPGGATKREDPNLAALPARHPGAGFCTGMSLFAIVILLLLAAAVSRDYRCVRCARPTWLLCASSRAAAAHWRCRAGDTPRGAPPPGAQIHRPGLEGQPGEPAVQRRGAEDNPGSGGHLRSLPGPLECVTPSSLTHCHASDSPGCARSAVLHGAGRSPQGLGWGRTQAPGGVDLCVLNPTARE